MAGHIRMGDRQSFRISGSKPFITLKIMTSSLNWTWKSVGSLCSSFSTGVIWSCVLDLTVVQFPCSKLIVVCVAPYWAFISTPPENGEFHMHKKMLLYPTANSLDFPPLSSVYELLLSRSVGLGIVRGLIRFQTWRWPLWSSFPLFTLEWPFCWNGGGGGRIVSENIGIVECNSLNTFVGYLLENLPIFSLFWSVFMLHCSRISNPLTQR